MSAPSQSRGRAEACANIALAKYWGKSPRGGNLTAVPSLSLTLDALRTRTEVSFEADLAADECTLNGELVSGDGGQRVTAMLDRFRARASDARRARVTTLNNFPTAAGLASSASGFAALAVAIQSALGLSLTRGALSSEARQSSASAGRSLFGGFVELLAEADEAAPIAPPAHWDVAMVVAVVEAGKKPVSSTGGMNHTAATSPYYPAWLDRAGAVFEEVRQGVLTRDFERVALGMEHSTRLMHATMFTSQPPVLYLRGATVELMHAIAERRAQGRPEAYTMDAGPNVKVLTTAEHLPATVEFLGRFPGVTRLFVCSPGSGARRLGVEGPLSEARPVGEES
ncbi:MAG TPA: diphosphomevalonate decarboxylase [Polyangiaceae bacterium]|nr:diphosphomevalonate decarboxylase [Polyangiaceae bacterium]